jgi:hypothetical protein
MNPRKAELRQIVLDIILKKEKTSCTSNAYYHLPMLATEILERRAGLTDPKSFENRLCENDRELVEEINIFGGR